MIKMLLIKVNKFIFSNNFFLIILIIFILNICIFKEIDYRFKILFLDIGQGDSILIKTPNYKYILIDGGEDTKVLDELGEVLPFWQTKIDIVIGTHSDCDHICGLKFVLEKYLVDTVFLNDLEGNDKDVHEIINICSSRNISLFEMYMGDFIDVNDLHLEALWPDENLLYENSNQKSIVLYGLFHEVDFLLTGDIELEQEDIITEEKDIYELEILKISHHGSKTATGMELLRRIRPKYAVISCGKNNKYNHPSDEVMNRLIDYSIITYRTDLNGRVEFTNNENNLEIKLEKKCNDM